MPAPPTETPTTAPSTQPVLTTPDGIVAGETIFATVSNFAPAPSRLHTEVYVYEYFQLYIYIYIFIYTNATCSSTEIASSGGRPSDDTATSAEVAFDGGLPAGDYAARAAVYPEGISSACVPLTVANLPTATATAVAPVITRTPSSVPTAGATATATGTASPTASASASASPSFPTLPAFEGPTVNDRVVISGLIAVDPDRAGTYTTEATSAQQTGATRLAYAGELTLDVIAEVGGQAQLVAQGTTGADGTVTLAIPATVPYAVIAADDPAGLANASAFLDGGVTGSVVAIRYVVQDGSASPSASGSANASVSASASASAAASASNGASATAAGSAQALPTATARTDATGLPNTGASPGPSGGNAGLLLTLLAAVGLGALALRLRRQTAF